MKYLFLLHKFEWFFWMIQYRSWSPCLSPHSLSIIDWNESFHIWTCAHKPLITRKNVLSCFIVSLEEIYWSWGLRGELERWGGQVGCITRLVPQKGVYLIHHSIYRTLEHGGQFILLGSSPIPHIQVWLMLHWAHIYILSNFLTRDGFKFSIQTMVVTIFRLVVYSMSLKELHANLIITLKFDWCWSMMRPSPTLSMLHRTSLWSPLYLSLVVSHRSGAPILLWLFKMLS